MQADRTANGDRERRRSRTLELAIVGVATLVAVGVAQAADLLTFLRMVALEGIAAEFNPIVSRTAVSHGLEVLAYAKFGLVLLVVGSVVAAGRSYPRLAALVLTMGTAAGLIGAASNVVALW